MYAGFKVHGKSSSLRKWVTLHFAFGWVITSVNCAAKICSVSNQKKNRCEDMNYASVVVCIIKDSLKIHMM